MEYLATKLKPLKSYPTYQFHAYTASNGLSADDVFIICILETLKWLRLRLNHYDLIPEELSAPEPECYSKFSKESLRSFNINFGAAMDCTYSPKRNVWSLRISEPDTGENLGTDTQRLPVNGRVFQTEISFIISDGKVETGVRTICSEPSDSNEPCAVFRPAVVREIANNPNVGFEIEGFRLNGKPLMITNQTEFRHLERLLRANGSSMPVVLVSDSAFKKNEVDISLLADDGKLSFKGFSAVNYTDDLKADLSNLDIDIKHPELKPKKPEKTETAPKTEETEPEPVCEKYIVFDYEKLAYKTMGFSIICFITANCFDLLKHKLGISLSPNEIIIIDNGTETERIKYTDDTIDSLYSKLKNDLRDMLKRSSFTYGNILFYSDARLADLKERHHENITLEEKVHIYRQEISELKARNRELSQQNTDLQIGTENNRSMQKQIKSLSDENESLKMYISNLKDELSARQEAYQKANELVHFYRQRTFDAAAFPTDKDDVCEWAKKNFSDNIMISQRAESALRKYSGGLSCAILCDGIYYLNAYADYRKGKLTADKLSLYADSYKWEIQGCGSGALRIRHEDYEMNIDGRKHTLDMHIKYGISSHSLIRIYFCWDNEQKKIIIGHMPDHLPTASQST